MTQNHQISQEHWKLQNITIIWKEVQDLRGWIENHNWQLTWALPVGADGVNLIWFCATTSPCKRPDFMLRKTWNLPSYRTDISFSEDHSILAFLLLPCPKHFSLCKMKPRKAKNEDGGTRTDRLHPVRCCPNMIIFVGRLNRCVTSCTCWTKGYFVLFLFWILWAQWQKKMSVFWKQCTSVK